MPDNNVSLAEPSLSDDSPSMFSASDNYEEKEAEFKAWNEIARALRTLKTDARHRVLKSIVTLFEVDISEHQPSPTRGIDVPGSHTPLAFSEERAMSAKDFLREKKPITDVDRIACLAYYLTHYLNTPHFKTFDLSKLNTEAAQIKFSNAAYAVDNATKTGLLVPASKGNKQISAMGEAYVQALPDRAAARAVMEEYRPRKKAKRSQPRTNSEE